MQDSLNVETSTNRPRPFSTTFPQSIDNINPPFQHFDEEALYTSLEERVTYLRAFLNFTHEDVEALNDIVSVFSRVCSGPNVSLTVLDYRMYCRSLCWSLWLRDSSIAFMPICSLSM